MGDFRLELSTITNAKLKKMADEANKNKSTDLDASTLDSTEASVFASMVDRAYNNHSLNEIERITKDEYDMGLALVKENKSATNPQENAKTPVDRKFDELVRRFKNFKEIRETNPEFKATMEKNGGHNFKEYLKIFKQQLKEDKEWDKVTKQAFKKLEKAVEIAAQQQKIEATKADYAGRTDVYTEVGYKDGKLAKKYQSVADKKKHAAKRDAEIGSISRKEMEKGLKLTAVLGIIPIKSGSSIADKFHRFKMLK